MSGKVTVAIAGDTAEADEIQAVLLRAGIESELEGAETDAAGMPHDGPCRILVGDLDVEAARDALTAADAEEDDGDLL